MRQTIVAVLLLACLVLIGAKRPAPEPNQKLINFEAQGFTKMNTTAYDVGHHTANGSAVHEGGCACSIDHIGDVAIIYTLEGEFLGYFECNDTGAEGGGVRNGTVVDIYRTDYDRCVDWMELTQGKCWVKWIEGEG